MPKPLSMDLRERILNDVLGGMTYAEAGRKYSVSAEFVRRFHRRYEATQEIAPRPPIPRVVPFYRKHEAAIRAAVADHSSLTLEQLKTQLGIEVSIGTLWHALQKLRITFKKKRSMQPSKNDRMSESNEPSSISFDLPASTLTDSSFWTKPGLKPI